MPLVGPDDDRWHDKSFRFVRPFECRHCGTTVESSEDACPYCDPGTDIVRYEIT